MGAPFYLNEGDKLDSQLTTGLICFSRRIVLALKRPKYACLLFRSVSTRCTVKCARVPDGECQRLRGQSSRQNAFRTWLARDVTTALSVALLEVRAPDKFTTFHCVHSVSPAW